MPALVRKDSPAPALRISLIYLAVRLAVDSAAASEEDETDLRREEIFRSA